jgi:diguanylate cyclase (GGDEF)-like protein/PAS domain S-box-containing protein
MTAERGPFRVAPHAHSRPWATGACVAAAIISGAVAFCRDSSLADPMMLAIDRWGHGAGLLVAIAATALLAAIALSLRRQFLKATCSHAHYKEIIDHANDGILICETFSRKLIYTNSVVQTRLGYDHAGILKMNLADLFATDDESMKTVQARFRGTQSQLALPMEHRCKDGSIIEVEVRCSTHTIDGREVCAFVTRDVSVSKKAELQLIENQARLARMAHHDQLTGLPNRHYIADFLPEAIASARAKGLMLGIVFLDLDRFKHINDTYGHETGDKLLQIAASRLRQCVRDADVIVRMGGDEFVVVFLNLRSDEEMTLAAGRIIEILNTPIIVDDRSLQTSASVGISLFPRDGDNMVELLKHSDTAMYQAKDRGRNNVQVFSQHMNERLKHRVAVEAMLREALRLKQLDVYYQPLINLGTRKTIGLEALIRWHHPAHGMIPADWFIPIAEETGLVVPIGNYVLHRALQDMSNWRKAGVSLVPVSLNVAPSQLLRGEFQSKIVTLLKSQNLGPELLQLEMTERGIFDSRAPRSGESRQDTLANLRDLGIKIAIDDFGTGYSSLAYLKHWRVDLLKIDKSFVRDIVTDASDLAIVSAIIAIARNLRIEVIAEGIESYQQADILENLGCHHGQGFLFARPMPADKCLGWLAKRQPGEEEFEDMIDNIAITGSHRL